MSLVSPSSELVRVAHHEAGHAVAYRVGGVDLDEVWAAPAWWRTLQGQAVYSAIPELDAGTFTGDVGPIQVGLAAGGAAEEAYLTLIGDTAGLRRVGAHCLTDHWWVANTTGRGQIGEAEAHRRAAALVEANWARIEEVAALLVERGRISGSEV